MGKMQVLNKYNDIPSEGGAIIGTFLTSCDECKHLLQAFETFSNQYPSITFCYQTIDVCIMHNHTDKISIFPDFSFQKNGRIFYFVQGFQLRELQKGITFLL
jgi:hypothetical protein